MDYYIGIDIGTTSTKAVAFAANGDILARETIAYPIHHPQPNYSEQDPAEIMEAVLNSSSRIAGNLAGHHPVLISFSSAMHSLLVMDENDEPITNCIIWADNRAAAIADELRASSTGRNFYRETGVPIHAMTPLCKLLWLKENDPSLFARAHKFIGIKEYIFYRLFGKYVVETANASATGLLNLRTLQWEPAILEYIGIRAEQLSAITTGQHTEYLTAEKHQQDARLQLLEHTAFVAGGSDGALANIGSGAVKPHSLAVSIGTSSAVRIVTQGVNIDPRMRTFCYHIADGNYITGGASNNGAVVLQWLKDTILETNETYDQLFAKAQQAPAGCNGLVFIPYILGERAPVWNSNAKGIFFGLDINHSQAHLIRAVMEGVVFNVYSIGRILMEKREVTEIYATGGFTQTPAWLQMLCDMFNCTVHVSGAVESSAFGAVKIGLEALKIATHWEPRITHSYEPDALLHGTYLQQFKKMERIYHAIAAEFHQEPIKTEA